mmetsp:Transcript_18297/g.26608  ORF Transcript_18297/g.26608 Transcript_18297/m.26608 type:complete len:142 (-) Transcript_18297:219-644(-)
MLKLVVMMLAVSGFLARAFVINPQTAMRPAALHAARYSFKVNAEKPEVVKQADFIAAIAEKTDLSKKDTEKVVKAFCENVMETVADGKKITFVGFGTFEPRARKARTGRNPKTGEALDIAASTAPGFSAGKAFKDKVKGSK